jgi:hypothetical protein
VKNTIHDFHSIHVSPQGRTWMGSLGQGVTLFNPTLQSLLTADLYQTCMKHRTGHFGRQ